MSLNNLRKAVVTIHNLQSLGGLLKPEALDRLNEAENHLGSIIDMVYDAPYPAPHYYNGKVREDRELTQNQG